MFQACKWKNLTRALAVTTAAGLLCTTPIAQAQEQEAQAQEQETGPNKGKISVSAGFDVTTAYFYRGLMQENQGFIIQPSVDLTFKLSDHVDLTFGIWNSFHDEQTLADGGGPSADGGPDWWYEADLYIGLSCSAVENMTFGLTYTALTSPNDAFGTVNELALSFAYDDSAMWEGTPIASGLQPSVSLVVELDGQSDGGSNEGIYLQLGIEPSFTLIESQDNPVTLSIPITVGLSLGDYYEDSASPGGDDDSTFGYLDIGFMLSMPLSAIPADYGQWTLSGGVHYLFLTEATESFNDSADGDEVIATFGMSMSY